MSAGTRVREMSVRGIGVRGVGWTSAWACAYVLVKPMHSTHSTTRPHFQIAVVLGWSWSGTGAWGQPVRMGVLIRRSLTHHDHHDLL